MKRRLPEGGLDAVPDYAWNLVIIKHGWKIPHGISLALVRHGHGKITIQMTVIKWNSHPLKSMEK